MSLIDNQQPLQPEYIPSKTVGRTDVLEELQSLFGPTYMPNVLLHGVRGTGKTLVAKKHLLNLEYNTVYISCNQYNTQYKALQQLYAALTGEKLQSGYHTAQLKQKIENRTSHTKHVIVLDELDFLLLNDGKDLLYYLSRTQNSENLGLILISSNQSSLKDQVDERTYSTLQPQRISLEPYTPEQVYKILADRIRQSLEPQSLHHDALTYTASTTQNTKIALHWLRYTARGEDEAITEETLRKTRTEAYQDYTERLLTQHSRHHLLLYNALRNTEEETMRSGDAYTAYREHCEESDVEPLSNRRISDLLKHLQLYNLIQTEYHYGGTAGKTREITVTTL